MCTPVVGHRMYVVVEALYMSLYIIDIVQCALNQEKVCINTAWLVAMQTNKIMRGYVCAHVYVYYVHGGCYMIESQIHLCVMELERQL